MATKKKFNAVAESRKWRTAAGKKLSSMDEEARLAYLNEDIAGKLQALRKKAVSGKTRRPRKARRNKDSTDQSVSA
jgi:hypothetical protein